MPFVSRTRCRDTAVQRKFTRARSGTCEQTGSSGLRTRSEHAVPIAPNKISNGRAHYRRRCLSATGINIVSVEPKRSLARSLRIPSVNAANNAVISFSASLAVAPGCKRPTAVGSTSSHLADRVLLEPRVACDLNCSSRSAGSGKSKSAGMMPTTVVGMLSRLIDCPTMFGFPPKRRCHNAVTKYARRCCCPVCLPARVKVRPMQWLAAQYVEVVERDYRTCHDLRLATAGDSEAHRPQMQPDSGTCAFDRDSKQTSASLRSRCVSPLAGAECQNVIKRSGSLRASGRNNTALTTLKIAVFAPMPSASVTTAIAANTGRFNSPRSANGNLE